MSDASIDRSRPAPGDGPTVVLVHGAWGTAGDWDDVVDGLAERGIAAVVADLPTMRDPGATMHDDADHVAELAHAAPAPVVLCGHSYGGVVITQAAPACPEVAHLVYLAAVVPDIGDTVFGRSRDGGGGPGQRSPGDADSAEEVELLEDGTTIPTVWAAADWDYPSQALARMGRHPRRPFAHGGRLQSVTAAGWRDVPSTYLIAERDATIHPVRQREMAARCERLVELDSGHMVVHEHPDEVAELLAQVVADLVEV